MAVMILRVFFFFFGGRLVKWICHYIDWALGSWSRTMNIKYPTLSGMVQSTTRNRQKKKKKRTKNPGFSDETCFRVFYHTNRSIANDSYDFFFSKRLITNRHNPIPNPSEIKLEVTVNLELVQLIASLLNTTYYWHNSEENPILDWSKNAKPLGVRGRGGKQRVRLLYGLS